MFVRPESLKTLLSTTLTKSVFGATSIAAPGSAFRLAAWIELPRNVDACCCRYAAESPMLLNLFCRSALSAQQI